MKTYVIAVNEKGEFIPTKGEVVTRKDKLTFWILFLIAITPLLLAFLVIIYLFFIQPHQIKGNAMLPNYTDGEYYLTLKSYGELRRGDVIVFKAPNNPEADYFKRIIGLPGEVVEIRGGSVYINSQVLQEPYLKSGTATYSYPGRFMKENQRIIIPQNQYFVLGDYREKSTDSREFGPIPKEAIIGKMAFCYWNCSPKLN